MRRICQTAAALISIFLLNYSESFAISLEHEGPELWSIKVDQFGYRNYDPKVAVVSVSGESSNSYLVRELQDRPFSIRSVDNKDEIHAALPRLWGDGKIHTQSGDIGLWLDFSSLTTSGRYYIVEPQSGIQSDSFVIKPDVYDAPLREAVRTFFYQRANFDKSYPFADPRWADSASYSGRWQDGEAKAANLRSTNIGPHDLRGGWFDAGDTNKYVPNTEAALVTLAFAFLNNPTLFTDDYGIPESGNGVPDIVDELRWGLLFVENMQEATGTGGLLLKVGVLNYRSYSPPSRDPRARFFVDECTSSTLAGAAVFATMAVVYGELDKIRYQKRIQKLIRRAKAALARGKTTTVNFTHFQTECDNQTVKAGSADVEEERQLGSAFLASALLAISTGEQGYAKLATKLFRRNMRYSYASWPGYSPHIREGLEFFANSKNGNPLIYQDLFSAWKLQTRNVLREHKNGTDLYRAHLPDWAYHWGSNAVKAVTGSAIASKHFSLKEKHRNLALNYLHWFHGLNPLGLVYLSNMSDFGASLSVSEIYHSWFSDGGDWDSAIFSRYGPPPGYIVGGPNASYSVPTISPPANMPAQRAYRDWNSDWPEKSWEVSEPSISYQAAYILLLAKATLANREEALSKSHHNEAAAYSSN